MNKKFTIITVLGIISLFAFSNQIEAKTIFEDVSDSHPYFKSINHLNYICPETFSDEDYFRPEDYVPRGDFIKILFCENLESEEWTEFEMNIPFDDVTGDEDFVPALKIALILNSIKGFEDNTFRDWADVTTMEAIKIIMNIESVNNTMIYGLYTDNKKEYSDWKFKYIDYANSLNLIDNVEDKIFAKLKRKDLARIIYRFDVLTNTNSNQYTESLDNEIDYLTLFVRKNQKDNLKDISDSLSLLNEYYLYQDELNLDIPFKSAIFGLLDGVTDPYTSVYENSSYMQDTTLFDQVNLGFTFEEKISNDFYYYRVDSVDEDSLAYKLGLRKGYALNDFYINEIYKENNSDVLNILPENKRQLLNDEDLPDYTHYITINYSNSAHSLSSKFIEYPVKILDNKKSRVELMNENIIYSRIRIFDMNAVSDLIDGLKSLNIQKEDVGGYILDLRGNTGGQIDSLMQISEQIFGPQTTIIQARDNKDETHEMKTINYNNSSLLRTPDVPWVILVDGHTASASEALAHAIIDLKENVTVIGSQSYGKGRMQAVFNVPEKNMILSITNGEMKSPNGNTIDIEGVTPDIFLDTAETFVHYDLSKDKSVQRAVKEIGK